MIGALTNSHPVSSEPGISPYISRRQHAATLVRIAAAGGQTVTPPPEGDFWVATFRDPAGNLLGIWQFGPR